jgi:hypothetical protein
VKEGVSNELVRDAIEKSAEVDLPPIKNSLALDSLRDV